MPKHIWIVNFEKHNPPHKVQNSDARGRPLKWVRLQADWYDDPAIGSLSEEYRWMWPAMVALAGKSTPPGRIDMDCDELAHELRTASDRVATALNHLWKKGRIRYTRVAEKTKEGGGGVAA